MVSTITLRKQLLNGKLDVNGLVNYKLELKSVYDSYIKNSNISNEEIFNLIMIYLDYYIYSESGDVLISDHEYDILMSKWMSEGGKLISESDILINQTKWDFVEHESPGMVGTVKKMYSFKELKEYLNKYVKPGRPRRFRIAPKFDGISSAIKISSDGRIICGVTRNDGMKGQDITKIVRNAENSERVATYYAMKLKPGQHIWVKTELCVGTHNFGKLIEEKEYANRRSATSGIVNSPKNVNLAKYVTIIPLASHNPSTDEVEYVPLDSKEVMISTPHGLMDEINEVLSRIRDSSYNFRTDGVVVYPLGEDMLPNFDDIMDDAIAYKVNTEEGLTRIKYGYVSVGRLGKATPMVKVEPVEVNETIANDVSLCSFDKYVNMDLHEGEQVIVYSAGDVIPQLRLPEDRHYNVNAPLLKIKKVCPYCNEKLSRYKNTYRCDNPDCIRVSAGRITNFITKLKAENVSDKTIEDLMMNKLIKDIPDIFELTVSDIEPLPGYGYDSAKIIINEFDKIRKTEIPVSTFIGALGIQGISEKKCKNLFKVMKLKNMLSMSKDELEFELLGADNTGETTAKIFATFIKENRKLIKHLISIMNIVTDIDWKGNVVFTGFRNSELEKQFNDIYYEVSSNVNSGTVAVIDASYSHDSTKCKAARKKGIDIVHVSEADKVLKGLSKRY